MSKQIILLVQFLIFSLITNAQQLHNKDTNDVIICSFEIEAGFPMGEKAWKKYLDSSLNKIDFSFFFPNPAQDRCISFRISFVVSKTGQITDIENKSDDELPALLLTEIKKIFAASPKWRAAKRNGQPVSSYRLQPFSIILAHNEN